MNYSHKLYFVTGRECTFDMQEIRNTVSDYIKVNYTNNVISDEPGQGRADFLVGQKGERWF